MTTDCSTKISSGRNHVCAFFNSMEEEHRVLRAFYKDGFDRDEKATHIVSGENGEDYIKRLVGSGINVEEMMAAGQLEVLAWTDLYLRVFRFDHDAILDSVEELIQSGVHAGYAHTKLIGHHMDWFFVDKPAMSNLVKYEARLNLLLSKHDCPVICNYDLSKSGASAAVDTLRTHPLVIIGGLLREKPFFVPPNQFLRVRRSTATAQPVSHSDDSRSNC
jgi:hypothetical protein